LGFFLGAGLGFFLCRYKPFSPPRGGAMGWDPTDLLRRSHLVTTYDDAMNDTIDLPRSFSLLAKKKKTKSPYAIACHRVEYELLLLPKGCGRTFQHSMGGQG
jgi:hypothetical protein